MISGNLEGFIEIIGIKVIKWAVCVSGVQLAACPACAPVCPPAGYLHPGSCMGWNCLGRLGRLVTPLPDVRETHQVSPRSWKNHLSKVGMTGFSFWLLEINTKEYETPPERGEEECTKSDLHKNVLFCHPLQDFVGKGRWEPPAHYLQDRNHDLIGK